MQKESKTQLDSGHKTWLWSDCRLVLRRTNPNNLSEESYENLEAEVQLQSEQIPEPFVPSLSFKKQFLFNANKQFFWTKAIPLPPVVVRLQKSYFQLLKEDQQIIMIYCELTVTYPSRKDTHFYLQEIRTTGEKKKRFSPTGQVQFNGIILKESSQQKKNSKFSLLITICASSLEQNKIILKTLISTAFYTQNLRIKRKKNKKKSKYVMKLISPDSFLKPFCSFDNIQKRFDKEKLIMYLKTCNQNAKKLSIKHPLYLIYHFNDIFKVYFDSREVDDLNQLLQAVAPQEQAQSKYFAANNALVCYDLLKSKKIKKQSSRIQNNKQVREKVTIRARIKQGLSFQKKLLMITFQSDVLQIIQNQIQNQKRYNFQSPFEKELNYQLTKLGNIFEKWTNVYLKINFLRDQQWCRYWRDIKRQKIFQAYQKHYEYTFNRLSALHLTGFCSQKASYN